MTESRTLTTRHVTELITRGEQKLLASSRAQARADQIRERQQVRLAARMQTVDRLQEEVARSADAMAKAGQTSSARHIAAVERLQRAQERLQREVAESANAFQRSGAAAATAGRHIDAYERQQRQAAAAGDRLAGSQHRVATSARTADAALTGSAAAARASTAAYGTAAAGAGRLARTAQATGAVLGGGAAFGLASLAKNALDFEQQMATVRATVGGSKQDFNDLSDLAIKLGADTKFSASESAVAMDILAKAGFNTRQVMAALPGTLALAAASGADLATATDIQASSMRAFNLEVEQAGHVADVLSLTANKSAVGVTDVGEALKYVAPVAQTAGQSFEDIAAAIGILGNSGIKGSQAGTTLNAAILRLIKPTKAAEAALHSLGTSSKELYGPNGLRPLPDILAELVAGAEKLPKAEGLRALTTIFGREPLPGLTTLVDKGAPALRKFSAELENSDGAAKRVSKTMQENTKDAAEQFFGALESGAIQIQRRFSPTIQRAFNDASKQIGDFADNDEAVDEVADTIGNAAEAMLHLGEATLPLIRAGAGALKLFADLPDEVQKSVLTFGLLTIASRKLAGSSALAGLTGAFSRTRKEMALTRAEAAATAASMGGASAAAGVSGALGAGRVGRATKTDVAVGRTTSGAYMMGAVPFGDLSGTARQQAVLARRQAAAAQRLATEQTRLSRALAASRATIGRARVPGGRATGLAGAGGALIGGALGGGDPFTGAASGAAAGAMAGPWGALAGALGGAAASAIVDDLTKAGTKRVERAAQRYADAIRSSTERGMDAGLKRRPASRVAQAVEAANDASAKGGLEAARANVNLGREFVAGLKGNRYQSASSIMGRFNAQLGGARGVGSQEEAARQMLEYARGLEKGGRVAQDTVQKLARRLKRDWGIVVEGADEAGGDAARAIDRRLSDRKAIGGAQKLADRLADTFADLPRVTVRSVPGAVAVLGTQLDRLEKVAKAKNVPKGMKEAAERELPGLRREYDRQLSRMARRLGISKDQARSWADDVTTATRRSKRGGEDVRTLTNAVDSLNRRMASGKQVAKEFGDLLGGLGAKLDQKTLDAFGALIATPNRQLDLSKRRGGAIRRYQGGGLVPAWISSGEELEFPDGRSGIVPGPRVAADNVFAMLPERTKVWTEDSQIKRAMGIPVDVENQVPHFATGGIATAVRSARGVGLRGERLVTAVAVAGPESNYVLTARLNNPGVEDSRGLWQINTLAHPKWAGRNLYNPDVNAQAMREISSGGSNWKPWSAYSSGRYRSFLGRARAAVGSTTGSTSSNGSDGTSDTTTRAVPVRYSRSRSRAGLLDNAASVGIDTVQRYGSLYAARRYGLTPLTAALRDAAASEEYFREIETKAKTGSSTSSSASGGIGGRGRMNWPTASRSITSRFGSRASPGGRGSTNHDGIDIGVPTGTAVFAAARGQVAQAGTNGGYGTYVGLDHRNGYYSFYGHLSRALVRRGQVVNSGAKIGLSGNTGTSTGPHLHFGIHRNGTRVNPLSMLGKNFRRGGAARAFRTGGRAFAQGVTSGYGAGLGRYSMAGVDDALGALRRRDVTLKSATGQRLLAQLDASLSEASNGRLEQLRRQLLREVRKGGDKKAVDRMRGALDAITAQLAGRIEENILGVAEGAAKRERAQQKRRTAAAIEGVDDSSLAGLNLNASLAAETIATSKDDRAKLVQARERAKAQAARAKTQADRETFLEQAQRARDAIEELDDRVDDAKVTMAQAARERPRVAAQERIATTDLAIARATLTDDPADDRAANQTRERIIAEELDKAKARGDEQAQIELIGELRSVRDALKENTDAQREQSERLDALRDLEKERVDRLARVEQGLMNETHFLGRLAASLDVELGNRAATGFATPGTVSTPGGW
ncbi:phage tail tape measure protein [Patulibacter brassicae]|uniref:Phage tail tape measure protein n=1 Tax=Patulibacter brassicae TaxID=1705717 RepID=A0ABU4VH25_9ACTN|nr:phage tail tape measure protein [Patulibacter brassicae]MDX8151088.1 phage tail tape measure protein [Patulibacter brassicae]